MTALLDLVRALIDYGKQLAATLHQRAAENPYFVVLNYATNDLALVMARITRGLLRAQALEERLVRLAARQPRQRAPSKDAPQRKPRTRPPAAPALDDATLLTHMPTPEEIATEVRRRPIGAVIIDIIRDLAIRPDHPLWGQMQKAVVDNGGGYLRLMKHVITRHIRLAAELVTPPEPPPLMLPSATSAATGPP